MTEPARASVLLFRRTDNDLLMGLGCALANEHLSRTGHDWQRRRLNPCCECCMYLRILFDELEQRVYDGAELDRAKEGQ